jgi:hypothetical protein
MKREGDTAQQKMIRISKLVLQVCIFDDFDNCILKYCSPVGVNLQKYWRKCLLDGN